MRFQIEKRCCGSEVITPQSLKSSFFSPQEEGGGSVQQLSRTEICDCTHENDHERLASAMLTCPANNICFSLRFKEKRAARRVRKSVFFFASGGGGGGQCNII